MRSSMVLLLALHSLVACDRADTDPNEDTGVPVEPNEAPTATIIELSPSAPTTDQAVTVVHISEATDPNGDEVSYRYSWFKDGELQDDLTDATLPSDRTARDESWRVVVVPTDGELDGPPADGQAVVQNTAPSITAELTPTEPSTLDELVVSITSSDLDGDEVSVAWAWTINDVPTVEFNGLVPASETIRDQVWTFKATPTDGTSTGAPVEGSVTILNSAPTVTVELQVDGAPAGDVFTTTLLESAVTFDDADGDDVALTYAWTVDGAEAGSETSLDGATAFDRDEQVVLTVTPNDGTSDGEAATASVTVLDTPPTSPTVTLLPGAPEAGDALVCEVTEEAFDLDGDPIHYTFDWDVDGTAFVAAEETAHADDTVAEGTTEYGDLWTCTVTTDAGGVTLDAQSHSVETVGCHPSDPVTATGWTRTYNVVVDNEAGTEEQTGLGEGDYRSVLSSGSTSWDVVQSQSCRADGSVVQEGWQGDVVLGSFAGLDLGGQEVTAATSTNEEPRPYLLAASLMEPGATWTYDYKMVVSAEFNFGGTPLDLSQTVLTTGAYEVIGRESVTVPAGTFFALHLRNTYSQDSPEEDSATLATFSSTSVSDLFYVDGLGLVKEVTTAADDPSDVVMSKELTAYTSLSPRE